MVQRGGGWGGLAFPLRFFSPREGVPVIVSSSLDVWLLGAVALLHCATFLKGWIWNVLSER